MIYKILLQKRIVSSQLDKLTEPELVDFNFKKYKITHHQYISAMTFKNSLRNLKKVI